MNNIFLLRSSYWVAAIADFIIAISILFPDRAGTDGYIYPMGLMSAVAFSWGIMLIFADRKPIERRWILIPTMLVVALLGFVSLHALIMGIMPFINVIPSIIASIIVFIWLLFGYIFSKKMVKNIK